MGHIIDNYRYWEPWDVIEVKDGRFEYILEGDHVSRYTLYLDGSEISEPLSFFPDSDTIKFEITKNTNGHAEYSVTGGALNTSMEKYRKEFEEKFGKRLRTPNEAGDGESPGPELDSILRLMREAVKIFIPVLLFQMNRTTLTGKFNTGNINLQSRITICMPCRFLQWICLHVV